MDIAKLTASIQSHEGTGPIKNGKFMPYPDSLGNLTQGYGHLVSGGISEAAAQQIFSDDLGYAISAAQAAPFWQYVAGNDNWENAIIELVYIMGVGGVAGFKNMLACLGRGDGVGAGNALLDSKFSAQVGQRAKDIAALFAS